MATSFNEVYDSFLSKIVDYSYSNLTDDELEEQLESLLINAIPKFRRCKQDLSDRDMNVKEFNFDLTDEEREVIAALMTVEYLKPRIITTDLMKMQLSDKDFKLYSQANQIKELMGMYKEMKAEAQKLINDYTYYNADMRDLS